MARYRAMGLSGLRDGRQGNRGAPWVLTAEEQALAARLHADFEQGLVWSGKEVQDWVRETTGKTVHLGRTYELMRAAGFSPQKPRPRHVNGDEVAKAAFKTKG
ncbi:winged helix-turn-helix domain-containing protein [Deinococcus sp. HMF7604]|uniref:winged helix-turn-helix domain-containing protein n=1 Tax=Deinococcus betulae TaxID=2873312 RepID=UPI001CCDD5D8|nr:winged helix-turn-helix domain-containing protein [Deinococcus betulae]MBZ9753593.1 winged helix-turn-helix domain-containing protein [Deinococcus betulae]